MSVVQPAFLLSLPRSGSTLLQRLLAAHSQVATVAEPWLLLSPLYALHGDGVYSEYGHSTAHQALVGLFDRLPGGRADYLDAVALMAGHVYDKLSPPGTKLFVDKTPRYGLVVDEMLDAFPDARFLVLHRNPLAVLASISATFDNHSWKPYRHKQDLFLLAERLLAAQMRTPETFISVRYEDLLRDPSTTLRRLISSLDLEWEPQVLKDFTAVAVSGKVGDRTGVEAYGHLSREPLTKWRLELASPMRQFWARRYLRWLGRERLALMGYNLDDLLDSLNSISSDYSTLGADLANSLKGVAWSLTEVEIARAKRRLFPNWKRIFTHT